MCDQQGNLEPGSSADRSSSGARQTVPLAMLFLKISKDLGIVRGLKIFKMVSKCKFRVHLNTVIKQTHVEKTVTEKQTCEDLLPAPTPR